MKKASPLLLIICGPSGVGKDAVLAALKQGGRPLHFAVTATTRPRRHGERDGVDYHFVSEEKFRGMLANGELVEWANVYGNLYGVPRDEVQGALSQGLDVIVKVDVQGAATLKKSVPEAVFIFLAPPSFEELKKRLRKRESESAQDFELRMKAAGKEMESLPLFDYVVVNHQDRIDSTIAQVNAIITAEKCRVQPRAVGIR